MFMITVDPFIFHVGPFTLRWYAVIFIIATFVGLWLAAREAERKGFRKDDIYGVAVWVIVAGLVGARLFHVLDHWTERYASNPNQAFNIGDGGLAIWGAIFGGLVAAGIVCWLKKWPFLRLLDAVAPGLILAQAVGRIACLITGEGVGKPTSGPFGIAYGDPNALVPKVGMLYAPMPIYDIIVSLLLFAIIWPLRKRDWQDGKLFLVFLILYSIERFFISFTGYYRIVAYGLVQAQIVAIVAFVIGLAVLAWMARRPQPQTF